MKNYDQLISYFEKQLEKQNFAGEPKELYEPISYTISYGGKRIRPVLTLMACELFCGDAEKALQQAIAIELFHNFTLIHDDIMDNAPIRRGRETVYRKWNGNIAILSGDTLFALAYHYAQQADKEILSPILSVFNQTAIEVCEGQQFDLNYETNNQVTVDKYINMIRLKTGVLFGASLKIGAIIGGASAEDADNLYHFGVNIGLGFQLQDDLLDTFGDETIFGKKTGGDIITNKKTFLYLKALECSDADHREQLISLYNMDDIDAESKISQVKNIFNSLNINQLTATEIETFYNKGMEYLNKVKLEQSNKEILIDIASKMIQRDK